MDKLSKTNKAATFMTLATDPLDVLPVRLTASRSGNALRRHVRRISVGTVLLVSFAVAVSTAFAGAPKAPDTPKTSPKDGTHKDDWTIRILPGTKSHPAPPGPMMRHMPYEGAPTQHEGAHQSPAATQPPAAKATPAPAAADHSTNDGLRIVPTRQAAAPEFTRYEHIYRSIPYSRTAYEHDPMYRQVLALSLLLNQFPPAPTIMSPGSSGAGQPGGSRGTPAGGPMGPPGGGQPFGGAMNLPPLPTDVAPEF